MTAHASLAPIDSGGIQEETTYLGTPCLTARPKTERPVTVTHGTNRLISSRAADLVAAAREALGTTSGHKTAPRPALWDGRAAERLVAALGEISG